MDPVQDKKQAIQTEPTIKAEEVFGYAQQIDGKNTFICMEDADKLAAGMRIKEVLDSALSKMGSTVQREPTIIVQHGVHQLLEKEPRILEEAVKGLRDLVHSELAPNPIVMDRESMDSWTYHYLVELRPDANAIIVRRSANGELGYQVNETPGKDGFRRDEVGIFPRFTIGENKDVFAFVGK